MILLLIGVLQYSMVKPYYRNSKIQTVKRVAEQIQEYMIDSNITDKDDISNAFQVTVDLASPEVHPLAKISKDVGAASVLLAAILAAIIGILILVPAILEKINILD